jgi:hypothetical protein
MQTNIYRVPGSVRRSLHRGATTVVVPSFTDDFSTLTPYLPISATVTTGGLYDGDLGIATGIGASGGPTAWSTGFLGDFGVWEQSPLTRFVGAT